MHGHLKPKAILGREQEVLRNTSKRLTRTSEARGSENLIKPRKINKFKVILDPEDLENTRKSMKQAQTEQANLIKPQNKNSCMPSNR